MSVVAVLVANAAVSINPHALTDTQLGAPLDALPNSSTP